MTNEILMDDVIAHNGQSIVVEQTATYREIWTRQDDKIYIERTRYVDAILDDNKRAQNEFSRTSALGDMVRVASIPKQMHFEWEAEGILDDETALARRLNDSDYQYFRTNSLRV